MVDYNEIRYGYEKAQRGYRAGTILCSSLFFLFFRVERTDQNEDSADHIDCRDRSRARRPLGSSGSALVEHLLCHLRQLSPVQRDMAVHMLHLAFRAAQELGPEE